MSLVRLLTAGKSLVGIQDLKSRYRLSDPRALPKFGSEKKINTEVAGENVGRPCVARTSIESSKPKVEKTPVTVARPERSSGWVRQWGSKLSSLVSAKPKPARSALPRFSSLPVQGELSLDNIKVVRNDLSDADLEVVTRKSAPAKKPEAEMEWAPAEKPERQSGMFSAVKL
jgi:hypothetical protein